mgnify:FL=1|jgi:phosphatidylglycerophosphate synthase|tara:strand:- start:8553 stop:9458 length:906 start_codon:yes stop_codon:yes gene_type:complete
MNPKCCSNDKCSETGNSENSAVDAPDKHAKYAYLSEFRVPKMDCPAEERLIRMALETVEPGVLLQFDIPQRQVRVFHTVNANEITPKMHSLGLGASLTKTGPVKHEEVTQARQSTASGSQREGLILKWLLGINAVMFAVEFVTGWLAQSTGLIADSLDMFADAAVYGVALYAVGRSSKVQLNAAQLAGWLQLILAFGVISEVIRRYLFGSEPVSTLMLIMGAIALVANVICLSLIHQQKESGAHMKASWIFSANDVIANAGVILAGLLVTWTGSRYPDLVIGFIIGLVVLNGARRILQLKA